MIISSRAYAVRGSARTRMPCMDQLARVCRACTRTICVDLRPSVNPRTSGYELVANFPRAVKGVRDQIMNSVGRIWFF